MNSSRVVMGMAAALAMASVGFAACAGTSLFTQAECLALAKQTYAADLRVANTKPFIVRQYYIGLAWIAYNEAVDICYATTSPPAGPTAGKKPVGAPGGPINPF
jgi:hypothetical protein